MSDTKIYFTYNFMSYNRFFREHMFLYFLTIFKITLRKLRAFLYLAIHIICYNL